jgi:hypothetical protein
MIASQNTRVPKVFIAYSRRDALLSERLSAALTEAGLTVFRDVNVQVGEPWAERIENEILSSQCVVTLLTPDSSQSGDVLIEAEIAEKAGNLLVVQLGSDPFIGRRFDEVQYRYRPLMKSVVLWDPSSANGLEAVVEAVRNKIDSSRTE